MTQSGFRLTAKLGQLSWGMTAPNTHPDGQQREETRAWRASANVSKQALASPLFGTSFAKASYEIAVFVAALVRRASSGTDKWLDT